ncbi:MAG TPA: hypothetical protein PKN79_03775, partial [Sphaerochaeta sp.]|nr:hypothetical protein [Sphaerochaeta sp.]
MGLGGARLALNGELRIFQNDGEVDRFLIGGNLFGNERDVQIVAADQMEFRADRRPFRIVRERNPNPRSRLGKADTFDGKANRLKQSETVFRK